VPLPRSGVMLPLAGLGTGTLPQERITGAVATFIRRGGRHLDTAVMYDNYAELRAGVVASGLEDRSSLVVTWKVMPLGRDYVNKAVDTALKELGVESLDLALLHWPGDITSGKLMHGKPIPDCVSKESDPASGGAVHSWQACRRESYAALLEERKAGRIRAVGVSNFAAKHLDDFASEGLEPPAVHQMEIHPLWHDDDMLVRARRDGTIIQGYGCLGGKHTGATLLRNEGFRKISLQTNKSPAQVLLRWAVQRGASVIAGGSSEKHIGDNLDIFDFELNPTQMDFMDSIDPDAMKRMYGPAPEEIL